MTKGSVDQIIATLRGLKEHDRSTIEQIQERLRGDDKACSLVLISAQEGTSPALGPTDAGAPMPFTAASPDRRFSAL